MSGTNTFIGKIFAGLIGAVTTIVAQRLVALAWKAITGKEPPSPTNPETSALSAVTWVVASGIGVGVAQMFAQRFAARRWAIGGGEAPETKVKIKV
ncbi:MAG TPA: DUF4235 domain-containing protein [Microlunatus sp.]|nr:DUF4235 domain-containing protein [Microlunatus sp.]